MGTNKERIEQLEEGLHRMELGMADRLQHLEDMLNRLSDVLLANQEPANLGNQQREGPEGEPANLDGDKEGCELFKIGSSAVTSGSYSRMDLLQKMLLYPKGKGVGMGTHLSLYLVLDLETLPAGCRVYADLTLRIVDQVHDRAYDQIGRAKRWFNATSSESGWSKFISLRYLQSTDHLVANDICIIEAELLSLKMEEVMAAVMSEFCRSDPSLFARQFPTDAEDGLNIAGTRNTRALVVADPGQ
ncbi:hypothetical protein SADUNF_Sadunf08G0002900 [Salix dunnii]|uniref:MATH domain-containing protein n=1 Tax=Salix dunnii TaxID=1413687 RepID=A0A835MWX0_9ROSI|nr:hypothetical protein SADUNF_Sadunf08G0002900 [Salix dunnii]